MIGYDNEQQTSLTLELVPELIIKAIISSWGKLTRIKNQSSVKNIIIGKLSMLMKFSAATAF